MNKLLSMELKRAAKSPILWLGVIAVIAINVYGMLRLLLCASSQYLLCTLL